MTITELKDAIVHKTLKHFYVFKGEEVGIMNIYIDQISKVCDRPIMRVDSVARIYNQCTTRTLFGNSINLYVIRNDTDFIKQEKVFTTIEQDIGENIIILLYDKLDSRLKFTKFFSDVTVEFDKLSRDVLRKYIQQRINLSDRNADTLIDVCSGYYDVCMLEVDKLIQYVSYHKLPSTYSDSVFEEFLEKGTIYQSSEYDIFNIVECIMLHNYSTLSGFIKDMKLSDISGINLLGTLYNTIKATLLIQCCEGKNISEVTGLTNGQIYYNRKYVNKWPTENLINALKVIEKVVYGIKIGWIDESVSVTYTLCKIL